MLSTEIVRRGIPLTVNDCYQHIFDSVVNDIGFRTNNRNCRSSLIYIREFCEFYFNSYSLFFTYHFLPEQFVVD